ncbi:fluoride efflux transporter CrcB [Phytomonospora sp. NPDC050363]|uniref:fluoride efflux transporter CrcB n=1 Tax=Phytomonospora sp. NPDC050363 TaxID=3155642 RepID=UPI00340EFBB7
MRATLAAVSLGGVVGALGRHGLTILIPTPSGWPLGTFLVNVSGCLAMGVLLGYLARHRTPPLTQPFLGVGVLGGYTTFSTYADETRGLLADGRVTAAVLYVVASLVLGLAAVWVGLTVMRRAPRAAGNAGETS